MDNFNEKVSFIWSVADLLRGPYRPNQYKDVMLPMTVLRRLDCVLEPTKEKVLGRLKSLQGGKLKNIEPILCRVSGVPFYNTSRFITLEKLKGDPNNIASNLTHYIKGFSTQARKIIEHFGFGEHIAKLDKADRLYGEFKENEHVRIFDYSDLGYRRITVERPLRLNFAENNEGLARLKEATAFSNLATSRKRKDTKAAQAEIAEGMGLQNAIISALEGVAVKGVVKNREEFVKMLKEAFKESGVKVPAVLFKAILTALSGRDETADICTDSNGKPEPDPELRDYENVPLKEDVGEYIKREVLPHVPDAWMDESKTKIGYEVNFNRYFYKYTPPRPLGQIEADLKQIEKKIAEMLSKVTE
ncbi:MAG: type I restriction-modification system subunit M N-terminal domain-containing protein [Nitrospirae bacterium]|nr:type I restriction-modification system subunit M N-terminal domain-containing protein [Nitrospirota bacterium]